LRESKIERKLTEQVEEIGGECWKFISPARSGVPDRIVMMPMQRIWFVETKAPKGELSALQKFIRGVLQRLGFHYRVIGTMEDVDAFIDAISSPEPSHIP